MSDDGQHALAIIAFIGYVFSPRYARAQRRGQGSPSAHAALNAAFYSPRRHRWALTEYPDAAVLDNGRALRLGANELRWSGDALRIVVNEREAPLPRRLRAFIDVRPGIVSDLEWPLGETAAHWWYPLAPHARVSVQLPEGAHWSGTGYLDCNRGTGALEDSFSGWTWLRAHGSAGTTVVYETADPGSACLQRRHLLQFTGSQDRVLIGTPPQAQPLPRTAWGLPRTVACDPCAVPRLLRTLEDTPFYARSLVDTQIEGARLQAVHESLSLKRFQSHWVRSLLPFRSHRAR